jgi:hypothetical protein
MPNSPGASTASRAGERSAGEQLVRRVRQYAGEVHVLGIGERLSELEPECALARCCRGIVRSRGVGGECGARRHELRGLQRVRGDGQDQGQLEWRVLLRGSGSEDREARLAQG